MKEKTLLHSTEQTNYFHNSSKLRYACLYLLILIFGYLYCFASCEMKIK